MLIALASQLPIKPATANLDFYLHDTYFVVGPRYGFLGFALLWGVIAGFYYFGDLALGNRLNNGLTLAHFALWIFSLVVSFAVEFALVRAILSGHEPNPSRWMVAWSVVVVPAFLIGLVLFVINFTLALVRKLRAS